MERRKSLSVLLHMPRRKSLKRVGARSRQTPRDGEGRRDHAEGAAMLHSDVLTGCRVVERARASPIERHLGWNGVDHGLCEVICS